MGTAKAITHYKITILEPVMELTPLDPLAAELTEQFGISSRTRFCDLLFIGLLRDIFAKGHTGSQAIPPLPLWYDVASNGRVLLCA